MRVLVADLHIPYTPVKAFECSSTQICIDSSSLDLTLYEMHSLITPLPTVLSSRNFLDLTKKKESACIRKRKALPFQMSLMPYC